MSCSLPGNLLVASKGALEKHESMIALPFFEAERSRSGPDFSEPHFNEDVRLTTYRAKDGSACSLTQAVLLLTVNDNERSWTPFELKATLDSLEFAG